MDKTRIIKITAIPIFLIGIFLGPTPVLARDVITDWYIKNFDSRITVNKDSSLDIVEEITADCGNLPDKHGIFRILPEQVNLGYGEKIATPVKLINIKDAKGNSVKYSESRNYSDHTVTWKIGDPGRTVQGVNSYVIHYQVKNAIRFSNSEFDELYWNLNGNFWDIETDNFHASVIFPTEISEDNSKVEYYAGYAGEKRKDLAAYHWSRSNVLDFNSTSTLKARQGITASITFPKNIIMPYIPGFWEKNGKYFWLILPVIALFFCFYLWRKYGKDPEVKKPIIAEYDVPGKLTPAEMGMLLSNGTFSKDLITAEIINLACKGLLIIQEKTDKVLFFNMKDYTLTKKPDGKKEQELVPLQKKILDKIFDGGDEVKLSDLKNSFYTVVKDVEDNARQMLESKRLLTRAGYRFSIGQMILGAIMIVGSGVSFGTTGSGYLAANLLLSGLIIFFFGLAMPKRTAEGADLNREAKGFKLFMETVDKDRAKFYEEQNIFEKFLPYAIVFGITGLWIKKMKEIYGEDYFQAHAPLWYVGASAANFSADSFSGAIDSLSSSIATNTSSPSGSGGGGFSGGGGGGGGGGGW